MCKATVALQKYNIGSLLYVGMQIRTKNWIKFTVKRVASSGVQFGARAVWCPCVAFRFCRSV